MSFLNKKSVLILILVLFIIQINFGFTSELIDNRISKAEEHASAEATKLAYSDALNDYLENKDNDYYESILETNEITKQYNLEGETKNYKSAFIHKFLDIYKVVYETTYSDLNIERKNNSLSGNLYNLAKSEASGYGMRDANYFATQEVYKELNMNFDRNLETDYELIEKFKLRDYSDLYIETFLDTYKKTYKVSYISSYIANKRESFDFEYGNSFSDGYSLGYLEGVMFGSHNYIHETFSNWEIMYKYFINNGDLTTRYDLDRMTKRYQETFKSGVQKGFKEGYLGTFQKSMLDKNMKNVNYTYLTSSADTLTHSTHLEIVKEGSVTSKETENVEVEIQEGTVYTPLAFLELKKGVLDADNGFISSFYNLGLRWKKSINIEKPFVFKINMPGNYNLGFYRYEKGQWIYVDTKYNKDTISTEIPSGKFSNVQIALKRKPKDLNFNPNYTLNWAYPEYKVNTIREYIPEEYPLNYYITRGEFVEILYKHINGNKIINTDWVIDFEDIDNSSDLAYYANYAVKNNYVYLFGDKTKFNPNLYISYKDVIYILNQITNRNMTLNEINKNLMFNRYVQMKHNLEGTNPITRGEVLYLIEYSKGSSLFLK